MYTLRMLGGISLSAGDGHEVDALLRQPKRIALFAYLAMPRPGAWHRRDTLLTIFWPELDQDRARTALRNALYVLRQNLDDGVLRTRGDDEIAVNPDLVTTDVGTMLDFLAEGKLAEALAHYCGDFLPGLFIPNAEGFEKWIDQERAQALGVAHRAAVSLVLEREHAGDLPGAVEAARRVLALNENDEAAARRLISLLDRAGDRAQALAAYDQFRDRVLAEFQAEPSSETRALVDQIRAHRATPFVMRSAPTAGETHHTLEPAPRSPLPSPRTKWLVPAATLILTVGSVWLLGRPAKGGGQAYETKHVLVLPMDNNTSDPAKDYIASGLAEEIAERLGRVGGLDVRSAARSEWADTLRNDFPTIAKEYGASLLIRTTLARVDDSLLVRVSLADVGTNQESELRTLRFVPSGMHDVASQVAALVAGRILGAPMSEVPRLPVRAPDPESYRLTLEAWHQLLGVRNVPRAKDLFLRATAIDPLNARAWAGLSSAWTSQISNGNAPFNEGYDRAERSALRAIALDSLQGTAWANLGMARALRFRNLAAGESLVKKASAYEPANAEVMMVTSALYRVGWKWDQARDAIRIARQLDPLTPFYLDKEALVDFCADRPEAALKLYEAELALTPSQEEPYRGLSRAYAKLGRYDEAIAAWRSAATAVGNTRLAEELSHAQGEAGYWAQKHAEGVRALADLEARSKKGWVATLGRIAAHFAAGDSTTGFAALEAEVKNPDHLLYRIPCMPNFDEVRHTPHFLDIMRRVRPIPE